MNKIDALDRLKDLRECFRSYETIEVRIGDVEALDMAIDILKEATQEVSVQEQDVLSLSFDKTMLKDKLSRIDNLKNELEKECTCTFGILVSH